MGQNSSETTACINSSCAAAGLPAHAGVLEPPRQAHSSHPPKGESPIVTPLKTFPCPAVPCPTIVSLQMIGSVTELCSTAAITLLVATRCSLPLLSEEDSNGNAQNVVWDSVTISV